MNADEQRVTVVGDDLFEILGIPNAADELARVDLAAVIVREIRRRGLLHAAAAELLEIPQSDVAALIGVLDQPTRPGFDQASGGSC